MIFSNLPFFFPACLLSHFSHVLPLVTLWIVAHQALCPWDSPGKNTGMGWHALLQGIFSTQGLNPGLLHCRRILYQLSHHGSPWILEWVAYPFSRNRTTVSCIAGRFFTSWATREAWKKKMCVWYISHFLYSLFCWWTFRLFPCLGYCKQCCYKQWRACVFLN